PGCSVGARMFPTRDGFVGRSLDSTPPANRRLTIQATIMAWTSLCVSGLTGRVVMRLDFRCAVREGGTSTLYCGLLILRFGVRVPGGPQKVRLNCEYRPTSNLCMPMHERCRTRQAFSQ